MSEHPLAWRCHLMDVVPRQNDGEDGVGNDGWSESAVSFFRRESHLNDTVEIQARGDPVKNEEEGLLSYPVDILITETVIENAFAKSRKMKMFITQKLLKEKLAMLVAEAEGPNAFFGVTNDKDDSGELDTTLLDSSDITEEENHVVKDWLRPVIPSETEFFGRVTAITCRGQIYLHKYSDRRILRQIKSSFVAFDHDDTGWIREGQACIATYEDAEDFWYRAIIIQLYKNEAWIHYVDFGKWKLYHPDITTHLGTFLAS